MLFSVKMLTSHYYYNLIRSVAIRIILTILPLINSHSTILTIKDGLSSSLVNHIKQSSDGYVWISTEDGLSRYDGSKCETYYHVPGDTTSLVGNYIRLTYETHDGKIYVGALHGLQVYNHDYNCFSNIPMLLADGNTVSAFITGIVELQNGLIYIATSGHGLFKIVPGAHEAIQMDGFTGYYISSIMVDNNDNVWIATSDRGNSRISNNGFVYIVNTDNSNNINTFCQTPDGNIYAASNIGSIMLYDRNADIFRTICLPSYDNIKTLYPYNGQLLIGTDGNGLKTLNCQTHALSDYDMGALPFDTHKAKVHTLMADKWGNLWIGLFQRGAVIMPQTMNKFDYIGCKSALRNIIGSNYVSQLLYASNGMLYVGTDNDGLYAVNTTTWQTKHYPKPLTIMGLAEDDNGNIYIGTYNEGLWYINQKTTTIQQTKLIQHPDGTSPSINSIVPDHNGSIYIATMGDGLFKYNPQTNQIKRYPDCGGVAYQHTVNRLHNRWISRMCLVGKHLYMGTQDGVGCLNIETDNFVETMKTNRILPDHTIIDMAADSSGHVWITSNKGLVQIDQETTETQTFSIEKIASHENYKSVICDHNGDIWVTTSHELIRINGKTHVTTTYYEQDGIMTSEFAKRSVTIDPTNHLYFGGNDGVTFFSANEITTHNQRPIIKIADLYITGRRVLPSTTSGGMRVKEPDSPYYHLYYTDNSFLIELTTMQFIPAPHMSYQYSINNEPFIETGSGNNRIPLRDMAPGTYNITFIGNNNGHLSDPISITIQIHPAWWTTWWAKTLLALLLITLLLIIIRQSIIRQRTKAQLTNTLHQQEVREAKMQLFTDIAHEIRTPMSLVISPLNELMSHDTDPSRTQNYDIIYRNTQRILRLMTQILDIQKIDAGKVDLQFYPTIVSNIIRDVCATFGFEARSKNITLTTITDSVNSIAIEVDNRHFDKIITNLVSNAIKYTPQNGHVVVRAYLDNNEPQNYIIEVEDDGNGFSTEEAEYLFDRFRRMPNAIESGTIGFGVGLDLTRTLVELHHGTIKALNCTEHQGGLIRISLPYSENTNADLLAEPTDAAETSAESVYTRRPRYNVLFVDDDQEMCKYVKRTLGIKHFNITTCNNGKEAINILLSQEIDIVVTDVVMPIMDGFTLCKNIKNNINISHIPIIILTSRTADTDRIESYENGADIYISKPFNTDVLIASIRNLITRREKIRADDMAKDIVTALPTPNTQSIDEKLLIKVTEYINKNIADPDYSIGNLASDVGMSRVHLHRRMRELTGLTTRDFVRNVRMKYASELLRNGKHEVSEVAIMTGFSTTSYFSQAFKAHFGVSPTAYMKKEN